MKLRYLMAAVPVLFSYGALTYAATKSLDHDDSNSVFEQSGNRVHESNQKDNQYGLKDEFNGLFKNYLEDQNLFLHVSKKEKHDHESGHNEEQGHNDHEGHDGGSGDGLSEVPLPAAFWLFAPSIIGLLRFKRKSL